MRQPKAKGRQQPSSNDKAAPSIAEPLTVTLSGNLSAVIRLYALIYGQTPEAFIVEGLIDNIRATSESEYLCLSSAEKLEAWLSKDPR